MQTGIVCAVLLVAAVCTWKYSRAFFMYNKRKLQTGMHGSVAEVAAVENYDSLPAANDGESWWTALPAIDQLQLALQLCQKALPVWENYSQAHSCHYRDAATAPVVTIEPGLLQRAIAAMETVAVPTAPSNAKENTDQLYAHFVGAVVALQDGTWQLPYATKKIFLAVYYLLQSRGEGAMLPGAENALSSSIRYALDCLDISRLYSDQALAGTTSGFQAK